MKLNNSGDFIWVKTIDNTGTNNANVWDLKINSLNELILSGDFMNTVDFNPSFYDTLNLTSASGNLPRNAYIAKYDQNGNFINAVKYGTNKEGNGPFKIEIDKNDNIVLLRNKWIYINQVSNTKHYYIEYLKMDNQLNTLWNKTISGGLYIGANGMAVDKNNNIFIGGDFSGIVDFNTDSVVQNIYSTLGQGSYDMYLLGIDQAGNFKFLNRYGDANSTGYINDIKVNNFNEVYLTGMYTYTMDVNPDTTMTFNLNGNGWGDTFIIKMTQDDVTSINTYQLENQFSNLYPNPNNGSFIIQTPLKAKISITNILGKEIFERNIDEGIQMFNIEQESSGIYLIKVVYSNNQQQVFKMIKQ